MKRHRLLSSEKPLVIDKDLAKLIGLNEAIVLQQIEYWIADINSEKGKKCHNFQDGYYWTYNSYEQWQGDFPFWSISTIRRILKKLEKGGLIITGNYNRMKIDRTKWYRINYKMLDELEYFASVQNEQFKWSDWIKHLSTLNSTIPKITTESSTEKNKYGTKTEFTHYLLFNDIRPYLIEQGYYVKLIDYYMKKYKRHTGKEHRGYTKEQWIAIADKFQDEIKVYDENDNEVIIEIYDHLIDEYFNNKFSQEIDRSVTHFLSPMILLNRYRNLN